MDTLDMRQLEAFRHVMEHGSVTMAAKILGISQPAVSTLISKLEESIGCSLFVREHRRLNPTTEALALIGEVKHLLERNIQLARTAQDIKNAKAGVLMINSHPSASIAWLPPVISSFIKERPNVKVKLVSRQSQGVRDLIETRSFDLAIAELPVEHPLVAVKKYRTRLVAVMHKYHPLASNSVITPEMLDGIPFISMFRGHIAQLGAASAFSDAGVKPNIVAECDYFASEIQMAANGVGVALVDIITAYSPGNLPVAIREFAPHIFYDFAIFYPNERPLSLLGKDFIKAFEESAGEFLE